MEACVLEAIKGILSSFEITAEELDVLLMHRNQMEKKGNILQELHWIQLENYPEMID